MRGYKPIAGHKGYFVNSAGKIWSAKSKRFIGFNSRGYRRVGLLTNGTRDTPFIHRLVFLHFVGPIPSDRQIHHKNSLRDDNRVENLELVTPQENLYHRWNK